MPYKSASISLGSPFSNKWIQPVEVSAIFYPTSYLPQKITQVCLFKKKKKTSINSYKCSSGAKNPDVPSPGAETLKIIHSSCNPHKVILHNFKDVLHPHLHPPNRQTKHTHTHRHIDTHTHTCMHTALSAALWVLSVHNMAAIILLAATVAWGQVREQRKEERNRH